jgi:hypothetical protein
MNIDLRLGDCLELMKDIPDNSIDLIATDPPYEKKYQYLYRGIAIHAARILKDGGSLLIILPHYAVDRVISHISEHLKWRWLCCMWQGDGTHPRMAMGVEVMWKPMGWWVKKAFPRGRGFVRDGFINPPFKKTRHDWEQSIEWAKYCMKFVPIDGTVLDPFMGTGTMGVACEFYKRNFIGIDNDPAVFAIAKERIEGMPW